MKHLHAENPLLPQTAQLQQQSCLGVRFALFASPLTVNRPNLQEEELELGAGRKQQQQQLLLSVKVDDEI